MLVYFIVYIFVMAMTFRKNDSSSDRGKCIFFLFFLGFLGYFRCFDVGADNIVYSLNFNMTTMNPNSFSAYTEFEIGFSYVIAFFKRIISTDYLTFMGALYVFWMISFYRFTSFFKEGYMLTLFVGISLLYFTHSYNAMRQTFALSLYIYTLPLLFSTKKYSLSLYIGLCILIGMLFHRTLIILGLLPLYRLPIIEKFLYKKKLLVCLTFMSLLAFVLKGSIYSLLSKASIFLDLLGERYSEYYEVAENAEKTASIFSAILDTFIVSLCIWLLPIKHKYYTFFVFSLFCGIFCQNLLGVLSALFLRVSMNFFLFEIIAIAIILNEKKLSMYKIILVAYCILIFVKAIVKNFDDIVPYTNQLFV